MKRLAPTIAAMLIASGAMASSDAVADSAPSVDLASPSVAFADSAKPSDRAGHSRHLRRFERFLERYEAANSAFLNGDPTLWLAITAEHDPVSIFGGFGGLGEAGVAEVHQRYLLAARAFQPSGAEAEFEYLVKDVQGKIAYTASPSRFGHVR